MLVTLGIFWASLMGLVVGFYIADKCSRMVWDVLQSLLLRRAIRRRLLQARDSHKTPQVGRRLPPSNGQKPPVPLWLREAVEK